VPNPRLQAIQEHLTLFGRALARETFAARNLFDSEPTQLT